MTQSTQAPYVTVWQTIRDRLETKKRAVTNEIRNYPQPIAGCDAQIPALWEQRDALVEDLGRLAQLSADGSSDALKKFVVSCSSLSADDKEKFTGQIRAVSASHTRSAAE